jgi:hypothetical protein
MKLNSVPLAGLLLAAAGCSVVRVVPPAEYITQHSPEVVWVTGTDDALVPVGSPHMVGDTLKGTWLGQSEPVAIPLSEIKTVQAKMKSPKRTALLFTVVGLAVGGAAYTVATAGTSGRVITGTTECGATKGTVNNYC